MQEREKRSLPRNAPRRSALNQPEPETERPALQARLGAACCICRRRPGFGEWLSAWASRSWRPFRLGVACHERGPIGSFRLHCARGASLGSQDPWHRNAEVAASSTTVNCYPQRSRAVCAAVYSAHLQQEQHLVFLRARFELQLGTANGLDQWLAPANRKSTRNPPLASATRKLEASLPAWLRHGENRNLLLFSKTSLPC